VSLGLTSCDSDPYHGFGCIAPESHPAVAKARSLSPEQLEKLEDIDNTEVFDHVHPETGEVFQLDALGLAIQESAKHEDFISVHIGLIDSIFRAFLVNDNRPLNPVELSEIIGRDASTILKTIGGVRVYRGIRPYQPSDEGD